MFYAVAHFAAAEATRQDLFLEPPRSGEAVTDDLQCAPHQLGGEKTIGCAKVLLYRTVPNFIAQEVAAKPPAKQRVSWGGLQGPKTREQPRLEIWQ